MNNIRLLLASSGFSNENVYKKFIDLSKNHNYKKAQIITTAHPKKENANWAIVTKAQIEKVVSSCSFVDFEKKESLDKDTDVVYVCGGNTFRLLKALRENNFLNQLENLFYRNGLYIGSSAGSIVLSPSIASADEVSSDKNICNLKDLTAFNLIDFHIIPHIEFVDIEEVRQFEKKYKKVEKLNNGEAIYISNSEKIKIT